MKDYYKILEISTTATPQEIKKSFRKLALKYHPDRTNNNKLAESKFKEIQEAYRALSNPVRKKDYNQKIYVREATVEQKSPVITPQSILQSLKQISAKTKAYDIGRIDQKSFYSIIRSHFSSYNINVIKEHKDLQINRFIVEEVLHLSRHFDFSYAEKISTPLKAIAQRDLETIDKINDFLVEKKRYSFWEKYKIIIVIFIALFLCLIIYEAAG